jgi:membrane-bound lytic murein transglycosylase D
VIDLPKVLEKSYAARCVDGPWPILANDLHTAVIPMVSYTPSAPAPAAKPERRYKVYKVRRGDSLAGIVRKLQCSSVQEVAELNGLKHHSVSVGQTLKLPDCR